MFPKRFLSQTRQKFLLFRQILDCLKWKEFTNYTLRSLKNGRTFLDTINPLPDDKILDWSKLKQIADDTLKSI